MLRGKRPSSPDSPAENPSGDNRSQQDGPVNDASYDASAHANLDLEVEVLKSLFGIHGVLFQFLAVDAPKSWAMRIARTNPQFREHEAFVEKLLSTVEGEIERNGFEIIKPKKGDRISPTTMVMVESVECTSDQDANRVAEVYQCGFTPSAGYGWDSVRNSIFQKCKVAVYRKAAGD